MIPTTVSSGGRQGKRGPGRAADNSDLKLRVGHQMIHNLPAEIGLNFNVAAATAWPGWRGSAKCQHNSRLSAAVFSPGQDQDIVPTVLWSPGS